MHTKDAQHFGETQLRLNLVAVWREATIFTEAERAGAHAAKHYDEDHVAALVSLIAEINA